MKVLNGNIRNSNKTKKSVVWKLIKKNKSIYFMWLIPTVSLIIFYYLPMYGIVVAFKDFRSSLGIINSQWNNFAHFKEMISDFLFLRAFRNTLILSMLNIIFGFPAPIILALMLNEVNNSKFKKITQSISYLPHFISWVVIAAILKDLLSPQSGPINYLLQITGKEYIYFLTDTNWFRPILVISGIWQSVGWGSVLYLAALTSVNTELYEASKIDGANRLQRAVYISIPSITNVIVILFILRLGAILTSNFEQIFNLYNPLVYEVADIIDTYVYRIGLINARYDYSAAVGLARNIIGVFLIATSNMIIRKYSEYSIW